MAGKPARKAALVVAAISAALVLFSVPVLLRTAAPSAGIQFDGYDSARIGSSPVGLFTIFNHSSSTLQWAADIQAPDPRFNMDQMLSSYLPMGQLAPGATQQFRSLVPQASGFTISLYEDKPNFILCRKWAELAVKHPYLKQLWNPSPVRRLLLDQQAYEVRSQSSSLPAKRRS